MTDLTDLHIVDRKHQPMDLDYCDQWIDHLQHNHKSITDHANELDAAGDHFAANILRQML